MTSLFAAPHDRSAARLRRRLIAWIHDGGGGPSASVAASAIALRGRLGVDRDGFAALLGVPAAMVAEIERGVVTMTDLLALWSDPAVARNDHGDEDVRHVAGPPS